jgi:hypothetical protein
MSPEFNPANIGELKCSDGDGQVCAIAVLQGRFKLLVKQGSTALGSIHYWVNDDYLKQGYVEKREGLYVFLKDCPFVSPSEAAKFIRNTRTADGPGFWKDNRGRSLRKLGYPTRRGS